LEYAGRKWVDYYPALWRRGQVFNQDFDSGDLSRMQSLRRFSFAAAVYTEAEAFFGALSLRWAVRFRDQTPLPGYRRIRGDGLMDWAEHQRPFPYIRLLTGWREEPGAIAALQAVPGLAPGEVVIETGRAGGHQSAGRGRLTIFEKSPERLRLGVEATDPTWLFVLLEFWIHRKV